MTVTDAENPVVTCPANIEQNTDAGQCYATVTIVAATATDNCGATVAGVRSDAKPLSDPYPKGLTTIAWTATDAAGNHASCTQTVTVQDHEAPNLTKGSIAACYQTAAAAEAAAITATSESDNCGPVTMTASTVGACDAAVVTVSWTDPSCNYTEVAYGTRIDNEVPVIGAVTATQFAANVKNCAGTILQGTVNISVVASDNCGLVNGHPAITLVNGATETATYVGGDGTSGNPFTYTWAVSAATASGTWTATVTASDICQSTTAIFTLCVNKTQISGAVQLEGFVGSGTVPLHTRTVVFAVTGADGSVLKRWTNALTFVGEAAPYMLTDVPATTAGLSAKTDWNLRRKLAVSFDGNAQAVADFIGTDLATGKQLKGGDIAWNGSPALYNAVIADDYSTLVANWLGSSPVADINGDGVVNVWDYSILAFNWYVTGDAE